MAKGIAHLSFAGGGIILPARSPYDREVLVEHVLNRVHVKGRVQVLVDERSWIVQLGDARRPLSCQHCGRRADSACYFWAGDGARFCVPCALGGDIVAAPTQDEPLREVVG
jgi:hypothetical protein